MTETDENGVTRTREAIDEEKIQSQLLKLAVVKTMGMEISGRNHGCMGAVGKRF